MFSSYSFLSLIIPTECMMANSEQAAQQRCVMHQVQRNNIMNPNLNATIHPLKVHVFIFLLLILAISARHYGLCGPRMSRSSFAVALFVPFSAPPLPLPTRTAGNVPRPNILIYSISFFNAYSRCHLSSPSTHHLCVTICHYLQVLTLLLKRHRSSRHWQALLV